MVSGAVLQAEIIPGVQDPDDVVPVLPAYREVCKTGFQDGLVPDRILVLHMKEHHVLSVGPGLLCRSIVKLEHVLDHLAFLRPDGPLLPALG